MTLALETSKKKMIRKLGLVTLLKSAMQRMELKLEPVLVDMEFVASVSKYEILFEF